MMIDVQNDYCQNQGIFTKMNSHITLVQKISPKLTLHFLSDSIENLLSLYHGNSICVKGDKW